MQEKHVKIGLGDALNRMLNVELDRRNRMASPSESISEVKMIVEALNAHKINLNLSCDSDPQVEGISVFQKSVQTSCCRIGGGQVHASAQPLSGSRS